MSEVFQECEQDFCAFLNSINQKADSIQFQSAESKEAAINEADFEIKQAENCIKQMEQEVASFSEEEKPVMLEKLRQHKDDLSAAKKVFYQHQDKYIAAKSKETLMGASLEEAKANDAKQKLMQQNLQLEEAKQTGYDMENIAIDAKVNLQKQSKQMEGVQESIHDFDNDLRSTNLMLDQIQRKRKMRKMAVTGVCGLVAVVAAYALLN